MKENYMKIVGAIMPDRLVSLIAEKAHQDKKNVENCCLEIIVRVLGDGNDLTKVGILNRLKENVQGEKLKDLLVRIQNKYGINSGEVGVILSTIIPILYENITKLDGSYFVSEVKEEPIIEKIDNNQNLSDEESIDQIFKNIEEKAEKQVIKNSKKERIIKEKKSLFKFKKKDKTKKEVLINEPIVEEKGFSLIEKICMIAVAAAFGALLITCIVLFIKILIK